jgi:site-specific DNA-methyltransferase (adenine-specific)
MNRLYFGDNLDVLKGMHAEIADLIYLDPPFNSNANYNVLFRAPTGDASESQLEAFRDTWKWGPVSEKAYDDVIGCGGEAALVLSGLRKWLGENDMMAYLSMMSARLVEMQRVLKQTGSLYLHCDPKASHYLKIILDAIFGRYNYRNEIIWCYRKWSVAAGQFVRNHDDIHFVTKSKGEHTFNVQYVEPSKGTMKRWKGQKQQAFFEEGVRFAGSVPDEEAKSPMPDWWDISIINPNAAERLGYPTQKPISLLKRAILASSNPGDVVLDPFCGCGTTVAAAEELKRQWIRIDVTHYAVTLIENRLLRLNSKAKYEVEGRPKTIEGAQELFRRDPHQFQWWAAWLLGAQSYQEAKEVKKGADRGIDGNIFYPNGPYGTGRIIVSVKGGTNLGVDMVRDLRGVIEREDAEIGVLITLHSPTRPMIAEAASAGFVRKSAHGRLPRLQIITITEMLSGKKFDLPPIPTPEIVRARAVPQKESDQFELLLPFDRKTVKTKKGEFVDPRILRFGMAS